MTTNKYLRYSIIGLLFLTPFVGYIVAIGLFFPYITGKNLFFRFLIELAAILYVCLALKSPAFRPKINSILIAFVSFIGILFLADIFGVSPAKSFGSNFERMEGFVTLAHLFVYFIILTSVFNTEKLWKKFFQVTLFSSIFVGIVGIDQQYLISNKAVPAFCTLGQTVSEKCVNFFKFFGFVSTDSPIDRVYAQLGNSTYLGAFMLFNIFLGVLLFARHIERPKSDKFLQWAIGLIYSLVILFDLYVFYSTGTRGALLGLVAGALFTSIAFAIFEKNKILKFSGVGVLVAIVIVVGLLAGFKNSNFVQSHTLLNRFAALATLDPKSLEDFATTQGKSRFTIWTIAYEGFKEHPVLGWGQENFNYVFNKYYDPKIYDQEQWFDRAHNVFFDWMIAGGILGLLSYLSLFVVAIIAVWRSRKREGEIYMMFSDKVILTSLFIAYFIHNLFVFDNITSYILFFGVLAFINLHERRTTSFPAFFKPIVNESYIMGGSIVAIVLGVFALYYFTLVPYLSGSALIKALTYQNYALSQNNEAGFQATLAAYQKSLDYNTLGKEQVREQLVQGTASVLSSGASNDTKVSFFNLVNKEMTSQLKETPNDARYYLFYGSFLTNVGTSASSTAMFEQGIAYLVKSHELSPQKQTILFELGSGYIDGHRYTEAVPVFKEAFDADQDYPEARLYYAISLVYNNDLRSSDEVLAPLNGTKYLGDARLIKAYFDTNQKTRVTDALKYKLIFANKLVEQGDKVGAIQQVQEVQMLNPGFKEQGDILIQQIQASK